MDINHEGLRSSRAYLAQNSTPERRLKVHSSAIELAARGSPGYRWPRLCVRSPPVLDVCAAQQPSCQWRSTSLRHVPLTLSAPVTTLAAPLATAEQLSSNQRPRQGDGVGCTWR